MAHAAGKPDDGHPTRPAEAETTRRLDVERLPDHLDRLYRAAVLLTGNRHDAEDLVQETYAQILKRPRFLHGDNDLGYLIRSMRHTWYRMSRRLGPAELVDLAEIEWMLEDDHRASDPHAVAELRQVLAAAATLSDAYREALVAVDIMGLSYKEAARTLRVREGTIMSRLHRARTRVAEALNDAPGA